MFYDRFEELCAQKGVKVGRACAEMGVSRSLAAKWKATGTERPSAEVLEKMSEYFGITIDEILGKEKAPPVNGDAPSIMKIYNALNENGRAELERYGNYLTAQDIYQRKDDKPNIEYIRHYIVPAAAGYASPIEGEDYELIPLDPKAPRGADYCISISGDSMEPYIHDGELAYVKRGADMQPFDVGVFYVDGDVLCKQYCHDAYRNLYLLSANPAREDANRTITADSGSSVVCYGKVLLRHRLPQPVYL
jgi:phage repressor protein C with HTH and peptisase S24 domain